MGEANISPGLTQVPGALNGASGYPSKRAHLAALAADEDYSEDAIGEIVELMLAWKLRPSRLAPE